jgi:hypothetical protein
MFRRKVQQSAAKSSASIGSGSRVRFRRNGGGSDASRGDLDLSDQWSSAADEGPDVGRQGFDAMPLKVDYYTSLARAVAGLDRDSYAARGAVYDTEPNKVTRPLNGFRS